MKKVLLLKQLFSIANLLSLVLTTFLIPISSLAAGVTIITHGFNSGTTTWLNDMANAIANEIPNGGKDNVGIYTLTIHDLYGGMSLVRDSGPDSFKSITGETIIKLDWSKYDDFSDITSAYTIAKLVADYLLEAPQIINYGPYIIELPLHLIGHSRGSIVCEQIARLLAEEGVWVDQVTGLDTRPLAPIDHIPKIYNNVIFSDNYWRESLSALSTGWSVPGAMNYVLNNSILLNGYGYNEDFSSIACHQYVHLWYHGTINTSLQPGTLIDGASIDNTWYYDPMPDRYTTGYCLSRIKGGERPISGINKQFEILHGSADRVAISPSSDPQWPNIMLVDLANYGDSYNINVGETRWFIFYYQDKDSPVDITLSAVKYPNPYMNQTVYWSSTKTYPQQNVPMMGSIPWTPTNADAGTYYIMAKITDGTHTRYYFLQKPVTVVSNDTTPPTPNPLTWSQEPYATGTTSIKMIATTANDPSGVEYYFDCLTTGGHDSSWQSSTTYEDTGLQPNTTYSYQVKARDKSPKHNTTSPSVIRSAKTIQSSLLPLPATNPTPANGESNVPYTSTVLSWIDGVRATSYALYFGTSNPPPYNMEVPILVHLNVKNLASYTTYYWRLDSKNSSGITQGNVWSFTTQPPPPPNKAINPIPANSSTNISKIPTLQWSSGGGVWTSCDVYFGTSNPPSFIRTQNTLTYDPGVLDYQKKYYWRIDFKNAGGKTIGDIWSFTTQNQPLPNKPVNPTPANQDNNVYVNTTLKLQWVNGGETNSYDIYFGTTNFPPLVAQNQVSTSFYPGKLSYGSKYFWRINAKNQSGTTPGDLWTFTASQMIYKLTGHTSAVRCVAFSPGGTSILTGSDDMSARLYATGTGTLIRSFPRHTASVTCLAFAPDGKKFLTGSGDKIVRLWDKDTGLYSWRFTAPGYINNLDFSSDGKSILAGSNSFSGTIPGIWDASSGMFMQNLIENMCFSFLPDKNKVVLGNFWNQEAIIYDIPSKQIIRRCKNYSNNVQIESANISSDGTKLLVWYNNYTLILWDMITGNIIKSLDISKYNPMTSICLSPDGTKVLLGLRDSTAKLINMATGELIQNYSNHLSDIYAVIFSPDGTKILTGSYDKTAILWNATFPQRPPRKPVLPNPTTGSINNPNKQVLSWWDGGYATSYDIYFGTNNPPPLVKQNYTSTNYNPNPLLPNTQYFWRIDAKNSNGKTQGDLWGFKTSLYLIQNYIGHMNSIQSVAISPNGKKLLTGSTDKLAIVWDLSKGTLERIYPGHTHYVSSVDFSPDGNKILTGSYDYTSKLWSALTGSLIRTYDYTSGFTKSQINQSVFTPDGNRILLGSVNGVIRLLNANDGVLVRSMSYYNYNLGGLAISPDGTKILTGLSNDTAIMWDLPTGNRYKTFIGHTGDINSVAFSEDGTKILTGSEDKTAKLWNVDTKVIIKSFVHPTPIKTVKISPDGKYILTGCSDSIARLWSTNTGLVVRTFTGHSGIINSVTFSPDGQMVLTGASDGIAKLWNCSSQSQAEFWKYYK